MTLANVLEEICAEEYALPANAPKHRFSLKHRRAMSKILYPDNLPKAEKKPALKRRVVIIAAIALLAVVTGAASIVRYGGFWFDRASNGGQVYYHMFAENAHDAPQTIEKICYKCSVPEKYQRIDSMCYLNENEAQEMYVDTNTDSPRLAVRVMQITKKSYVNIIEPEMVELKYVDVKGSQGFSYTYNDEGFVMNSVMWDCGDYIHLVVGTVSLEEIWNIVDGMTELT